MRRHPRAPLAHDQLLDLETREAPNRLTFAEGLEAAGLDPTRQPSFFDEEHSYD